MTYLWIDTFGTLQLRSQEATVSNFPTQHAKELLAYLLLNPYVKHTRLKIISLLWPDSPEKKGRGRLNTELWRLRTLLRQLNVPPEEILLTNRESVTFTPDNTVIIDCEQFRQHCLRARKIPDQNTKETILCKAVDLYHGDFCETVFADWCIIEREHLSRMYLNVLGQLMHFNLEEEEYLRAIEYGETILNEDPLREEVHRALMVCYVNLGLFSDAARQFNLCAQLLWEELHTLPLPETVNLFDQLLVDRYQTQLKLKSQDEEREKLRQTFLQYQEVSTRFRRLIEQPR